MRRLQGWNTPPNWTAPVTRLAAPEKVLAARRRPMSERLELALSWNAMAAELRAGLARRTNRHR